MAPEAAFVAAVTETGINGESMGIARSAPQHPSMHTSYRFSAQEQVTDVVMAPVAIPDCHDDGGVLSSPPRQVGLHHALSCVA